MTWGLTDEQANEDHISRIDRILKKDGQVLESFMKHLTERLPSDFGTQNVQRLASFLLLMLELDPSRRMSTTRLLDHPFLVESPH